MKKICLAFAALFVTAFVFSQGVTTSSMGGKITDASGEPLPGASVVAIHVPSGTTYGAATDFDGFYRISGMRPGGPYEVKISYVGFNDFVKQDVFLNLGQSFRISTNLSESATALDEVVLVGDNSGVFDSDKTGAQTNITLREINTLPTVSRSIADFARITPQAQIREGDDGFSISLAGQNNRLNAIYIDGAINNDVFGLAGSGTNGGQTGVNPFSVDAIESFQVALAPFDVRIGGFAGGAISAITRSGTNKVQGSVYGFLRNQDLAGETPPGLVGDGEERQKLADFSALTYGIRVGGPIIEDKLFYFVNYERQEDETPQPFLFSNYVGRSSRQDLDNLRQFVSDRYNYDIGGFDNNTRTLDSDKLTLKVDWNINQANKLSVRHNYVKAENLEARESDNTSISFINGSELFTSTTNSTSIELNSQIGNKFANSFVFGYTRVRDDRDPFGNPFPTVTIRDGSGDSEINFGAERFSTANLLNQDIFTLTNNFEIYQGAHTITIGTHNEYSRMKNLFFANNFGRYQYFDTFEDTNGDGENDTLVATALENFLNEEPADNYDRGYSLLAGPNVGDESTGASEFELLQLGFYVQDEIQLTDNFKATIGARFDIPIWEDGAENEDFNTRTVGLLEAAGKDLQDARVGRGVDTKVMFSPRVGFNWDVNGNRTTQIRGGFGIFTSRLPLVWPGGTYNNNGITGGSSDERDFTDPNALVFNPDVNSQPSHITPGSGEVGGNIDLFAPGFKLPQRFRTNIAIDQKLPFWGLIASADFIWTDNITEVFYENLNIGGPVGVLDGADNRPFYNFFDRIDPTYGGVYLASNTGGGDSYNFSFTLRKPFENGFAGQVSYSYGEANAIFEGTSSQNSSQWRNLQTVNGKNANPPVTRSDFNQGHRIIANVSYELRWNDNIKSTLSLFYTGEQAPPFTYVYGTPSFGDFILNDDSRDNALIYVPSSRDEINLVDSDDLTADQQWTALNSFIESDDYLSSRRGQYVERNGEQGPWSHILDLRFLQDFSLTTGNTKHTLQFSVDIFNFTNLLNSDWGERRTVGNFNEVSLINVVDGANSNPSFNFDPEILDRIEEIEDDGLQSSRWQMQLGLRYIFN